MNAEPLTLWVGALIRRLGNKCRLRTQAHLQSKWHDGKQSNNEKKTNPHKYTETIYYIRLCIYRSTDPLRYCWVVIKKIIWSMQTGKWGGRHWVVCCCCLHTADLYLYMYEWMSVCVSVSHRNPTPDDPWDWENIQTSCVLQVTCTFLCVTSRWTLGAVYRITSYFCGEVDWLHPIHGYVWLSFECDSPLPHCPTAPHFRFNPETLILSCCLPLLLSPGRIFSGLEGWNFICWFILF